MSKGNNIGNCSGLFRPSLRSASSKCGTRCDIGLSSSAFEIKSAEQTCLETKSADQTCLDYPSAVSLQELPSYLRSKVARMRRCIFGLNRVGIWA